MALEQANHVNQYHGKAAPLESLSPQANPLLLYINMSKYICTYVYVNIVHVYVHHIQVNTVPSQTHEEFYI